MIVRLTMSANVELVPRKDRKMEAILLRRIRDEMEQRGRKNLVPEQTNVTNVSSRKLLSCIAYSKVSCNSCLIYCFNVNRLVVQGLLNVSTLLIKCSLKCLFMSTVD